MIHQYALTHTPHFQGLTLFFQYLGVRTDSNLFFNVTDKAAKVFIATRGVWSKGLNIAREVITAPCIDKCKGGKKIDSLIEAGLSYFAFVENLWKEEELKMRLSTIIGYKEILFRT